MLRVLIVMPIYLGAMFYALRTPMFERFADMVRGTETSALAHMIDYGAALVLAFVLWLMIEPRTQSPRFGALFRTLKMGLIGVVIAAIYNLFCLFNGMEMSILILLTPPVFLLAEAIYETVETVLDLTLRRRARGFDGGPAQ